LTRRGYATILAAVRYGFAYGGLVAASMAFFTGTMAGSKVRADVPADAVVARVGSEVITAGELSRRIQALPPFQLRMFGKSEAEIKRSFLERVLVRDSLLAQGALDQKMDEQEGVRDRVRATLRAAMVQQIRLETLAIPITDEDVAKYYQDHIEQYRAPERVAIWRILVATREDAVKVLDELKKDGSVKRWNDLARERSLDKATNKRGGNLGYVSPDGKTTDAAIVVDKALLEAVKGLKDAELQREPVKEGDRWAVVWKRQTMRSVERPVDQEAPGIKQTIARQRTEDRLEALLGAGRKEHVRDLNVDLVDDITVTEQRELQPAKRPGVLPARRVPAGPPQPAPHDHR
jgi:peptidyl-prolyl cis-trans isomerase C